ncbi:DUF1731 domain-containing protein [Pseudoduganella sp. UC29_71]|uniref:DUF1731 domain-containing protein n=1 Tax=Pseudoduganella sp. UC29_71 TaxID=3350174 RepID=UPI0036727CCB
MATSMQEGDPLLFAGPQQRVLVTGATGFIGRLLVRALLNDGHAVVALTRSPQQAASLFSGAVRCVDSLDALAPSERIDVVVNLAGARILGWRWTAARKAALRRSRVALTERVVAWIARAEHKPRLMLSASAIGYYGVQAMGDTTPLAEDAPPQPVFMSQLCQEWEAAARAAGTGVGNGNGAGAGGGGGGRVTLRAAYNFTAPEQVSQAEFSRTAASLLGRPCFVPTPGWPVRLLLGEQADLLLEGQTVAPARLLEEGFRFRYQDLRGALAALLGK